MACTIALPTAAAKHGFEVAEVFAAAIRLARSAAGPDRIVFADVGPVANDLDAQKVADFIAQYSGTQAKRPANPNGNAAVTCPAG